MYMMGKGKSTTTVTAPDTVIPSGTGIVIKGTVMDMSPAQPNTPCVSTASMETQMEYLHKQMPIDGIWHNETITGVPVTLTAIDSNSKVYDLGSVTSDGYYGSFGMEWTPPVEGTYKIIASFGGDDSYGSSAAATYVAVGPAPSVAPTATATTNTQVTASDITNSLIVYLIAGIVVIIIAIAIVGALILRKK
jgi:hypothetical protein